MGEKKLEDFGEKIGGARKDLFRSRYSAQAYSTLNELEKEKYLRKEYIWPTPDYSGLIEKYGIDVECAFFIKVLRDMVPPSCVQTESGTYASGEALETVRVAYFKGISDVRSAIEEVLEAGGKSRDEIAKAVLEASLGWDEQGQAAIKPDYKTGRRMSDLTRWSSIGKIMGRAGEAGFIRHMQVEITRSGFPNVGEARREKRRLSAGFKVSEDAEAGGFKVDLNEWRILSTLKDNALALAQQTFVSKEDALEAIDLLLEERGESKDGKEQFVRPQLAHVHRDGLPDYRGGKDATPEMMMERFGFRAGEFGNWTNQDDRQQSLNHAYDAFVDLAAALKIPDKAMSLDGTLALAFGARGKARAAAHYEPERVVINLTKMNGAGSLAHEWFHALDNYILDRMMGKHTGGLATEKIEGSHYGLADHVRVQGGSPDENLKRSSALHDIAEPFTKAYRDVISVPRTLADIEEQSRAGIEKMQRQLRGWYSGFDTFFHPEQKHAEFVSDEHRAEWNRLHASVVGEDETHNHDRMEGIFKAANENLAKACAAIYADAVSPVEARVAAGTQDALKLTGAETPQLALQRLRQNVDAFKKVARSGFGSEYRNGIDNNMMWKNNYSDGFQNAERILKSSKGMKESDYRKAVKEVDAKRSKPYFSLPVEMFARAGETFIQGEIESKEGCRSQYLVHSASSKVYPQGEDEVRIRASFHENLIPSIQAALGKREEVVVAAAPAPPTLADMKREIASLMKTVPQKEWNSHLELSAKIKEFADAKARQQEPQSACV